MDKEFSDFMDLSQRQGKVLIVGEEGAGKTLLSSYIGVQKMLRGIQDCWKSYAEVDRINKLGYKFSKNYKHLLFSNYDINAKGTRIPSYKTHTVDPYRLGLPCEDYETDVLPPYAFVILTECQAIFNAYMWQYMRPEVRRFWETSRQHKVEIIMDTNQPNLVYKGMRDLTNRVVYLHEKVEEIKDHNGIVVGHRLFVKEFRRYQNFEKYLETSNEKLVKESFPLILRKCVYPNFDTEQCKWLNLKDREMQDYIIKHFPEIKTKEDLEIFISGFGAYVPDGYFVLPNDKVKSQKEDKNKKKEFFEDFCF